jgi:DNA-binding beta-propeller fold protein YncE
MLYDVAATDAPSPGWPAAPQVPRLEYAGQLVGEANFVVADEQVGSGQRFLRWLAGISNRGKQATQLVRPQSGMVDSAGRVLVTDAGRPSVFVFDETNGSFQLWREAAAGIDFVSPVGIAQLADGEFIVADAELGGAYILSHDGEPLRLFATDELQRPTGVDVDLATGEVFIADKAARQVKVFRPDGTLVRTIGSPGDTADTLNAPMHIRVADGKVFVADALNAHVLVYAEDSGVLLERIGRRGLYVGNLVRPKGVAVDGDGNIYVVESYYDHLLIYDEAGQFLLPIGGTGSEIGQFFLPSGAWSDADDRIFIADMFNGRVMIFRYVRADS